jgi:hypothetical protein
LPYHHSHHSNHQEVRNVQEEEAEDSEDRGRRSLSLYCPLPSLHVEEVAFSSESGEDNYESPGGSTLSGNSSDFSSIDGEEFFELERAISIEEAEGDLTAEEESFSTEGGTEQEVEGGNSDITAAPAPPLSSEILSPRQRKRLEKLRRKMFRKLNCGRCADTIRGCCDEGE